MTQTPRKSLLLIPRAAGGSVLEALRGALPVDAVPTVASAAEAPEGETAVVLREPASRLLSLYAALRTDPGAAPSTLAAAADQPLHDFLDDPRAAGHVDNHLARVLLGDDERLPASGFLAEGDAEAVADAAIARLDALGLALVAELEEDLWSGLGEFFEARLDAVGAPDPAPAPAPFPPLTAEAIALLGARCAADGLIYDHVAATRTGDADKARALGELALTRQLVRFGEQAGAAAGAAHADALADAEAARDRVREELAAAQAAADEARATAEQDAADRIAQLEAEVVEARAAAERDAADRIAQLEAEVAEARTQAGDPDRLAAVEAERDAARADAEAAAKVRDAATADADRAAAALKAAADQRAAAEQELESLRAEGAALVKAAADARAERDRAARERDELQAALDRLRKQGETSKSEGQELDRRRAGELAALREELADVRGSVSWKATAPLRIVEGRIGGLLKR